MADIAGADSTGHVANDRGHRKTERLKRSYCDTCIQPCSSAYVASERTSPGGYGIWGEPAQHLHGVASTRGKGSTFQAYRLPKAARSVFERSCSNSERRKEAIGSISLCPSTTWSRPRCTSSLIV